MKEQLEQGKIFMQFKNIIKMSRNFMEFIQERRGDKELSICNKSQINRDLKDSFKCELW